MKTLIAASVLATLPLASLAATTQGDVPSGWTYAGNAGSGTADGDVTAAPTASGGYTYVSTAGGLKGVGSLPGIGSGGPGTGSPTNGSTLTTSSFAATAGETLEFYFNFVTSDGAGWADYSWAKLLNIGSPEDDLLMFTARTVETGDTVPGFGMPAIGAGVSLTPSSTPIIGGGPVWSALQGYSGSCWDTGCGYTGWIKSTYSIKADGIYALSFGVTNWGDERYDTGMAIAGAKIGDKPIDPDEGGGPAPVPLPAAGWLMMAGLGGLGAMRAKRKSA